MRSTTRRRLNLCARCSSPTPAQHREPNAFLEWRSAKRFVVGGRISSRAELRANKAGLKRLISAAAETGIAFLSSELQPLVLGAGDNRYEVGA